MVREALRERERERDAPEAARRQKQPARGRKEREGWGSARGRRRGAAAAASAAAAPEAGKGGARGFAPGLRGTEALRSLCLWEGTKEGTRLGQAKRGRRAGMDMMLLVQGACCSNQWLAAVLLSLCCLLPSCRPAGQTVDFPGTAVDNLVVRKGDTAVLRCYLEDGASKGAWLNRSSIIFAGGDKWSVDPRVSIATANKREYSLQIQDVDVSDDGPYTCSVQTQHTPRTMQVHLTVKVSPKISHISNDLVVNEGSNITLACLATGKPEPSISWRHISPSAKPFQSGQYLDIFGITRDQAGEYECSAENDVSVPDVKKVKVTVNFSPTIQEIKSSGVTLGGTGFIRCESAGVPSPAFEWFRGERKLINGQQGITIKSYSSRSFLNFNNVTDEHFGNYTCVASNKLGTTNASLLLNPPSTNQLGITGGAEVLLSCWYLVLTLSSYTSILYLKNIILQ